jgi:endogenous inhibitor of DNA gyrase (YacG/DUF329 family)
MSQAPESPACVMCGRPTVEAYRPFCSKRCANVDLQRWLTGGYVIPGGGEDESEGAAPPQDDED